MVFTAYYVTIETQTPFDVGSYLHAAGQLSEALRNTLGDTTKLRAVTHTTALSQARVEVDITQSESSTIVARAIVQASTPKKMAFDKNLFTTMVRAELPFPVAISKRVVPKEELVEH